MSSSPLEAKRILLHFVATKRKRHDAADPMRQIFALSSTVFGQISSVFVEEDFLRDQDLTVDKKYAT